MFIRFEIAERDETSGREKGIFVAMDILLENNSLFEYEQNLEKEIYAWFKNNLKVPKVQSAESGYYAKPRSISWFKHTAAECIDKMRQYAQILESHDIAVSQLTTVRPGKVVYEDEHQIATIPYNDTFR